MKYIMHILSLILAAVLVVCSIVQFHHHHDDNEMCLAIHNKSCIHHHTSHQHSDANANFCHSHGHHHNHSCSLHLSDTINNVSQHTTDNNNSINIISSVVIFITNHITDLLIDTSHSGWPDFVKIGNILSACVSGWSLRAPPCA